jgi:hypothetical protein
MMKKLVPSVEHRVCAFTDAAEPFACIEFHREMLKTENSAFLGHGDEDVVALQAELFELIKIA